MPRWKQYNKPELMQSAIDTYFRQCDGNTKRVLTKDGSLVDIPAPIPYTIEGLCETLDMDRASLLNYQKTEGYEAFFNIIKKAKLKVQRNKIERALMGESNPVVSIFDLKANHGYIDKQQTELSGTIGIKEFTLNLDS